MVIVWTGDEKPMKFSFCPNHQSFADKRQLRYRQGWWGNNNKSLPDVQVIFGSSCEDEKWIIKNWPWGRFRMGCFFSSYLKKKKKEPFPFRTAVDQVHTLQFRLIFICMYFCCLNDTSLAPHSLAHQQKDEQRTEVCVCLTQCVCHVTQKWQSVCVPITQPVMVMNTYMQISPRWGLIVWLDVLQVDRCTISSCTKSTH